MKTKQELLDELLNAIDNAYCKLVAVRNRQDEYSGLYQQLDNIVDILGTAIDSYDDYSI